MSCIGDNDLQTIVVLHQEQKNKLMDLHDLMCEFSQNIRAFRTDVSLHSMRQFVQLRACMKEYRPVIEGIVSELKSSGAMEDLGVVIEENSLVELVLDMYQEAWLNLDTEKEHLKVFEFLHGEAMCECNEKDVLHYKVIHQ